MLGKNAYLLCSGSILVRKLQRLFKAGGIKRCQKGIVKSQHVLESKVLTEYADRIIKGHTAFSRVVESVHYMVELALELLTLRSRLLIVCGRLYPAYLESLFQL